MPDPNLDTTIRVRVDGRGVERGVSQTRKGIQSISSALERMQRVAAVTVLGGGAIESIRRTAGHGFPRTRGDRPSARRASLNSAAVPPHSRG